MGPRLSGSQPPNSAVLNGFSTGGQNGLADVVYRCDPRCMTESIGFRVYPTGERPDVEVRVDEDRWPGRGPLLVAEPVRLVGELLVASRSARSTSRTCGLTPWTVLMVERACDTASVTGSS